MFYKKAPYNLIMPEPKLKLTFCGFPLLDYTVTQDSFIHFKKQNHNKSVDIKELPTFGLDATLLLGEDLLSLPASAAGEMTDLRAFSMCTLNWDLLGDVRVDVAVAVIGEDNGEIL